MPHRLLLLTLRTVSISQQYMMESTVEECMAYSQFSNIDFLLPFPPSTPADITDSVTLLDTENRCLPLLSSFQCCFHCSITSLHTILSPSDLNKEMMDSTLSLFTASFASLSAFSFARMPTCAGTHIREILTPLLATSPYCQEDLMHKILPAPRSTPPNTFDRRHRVTAHQDTTIFKLSHPLYCHQDSSQLNSKYTQIV